MMLRALALLVSGAAAIVREATQLRVLAEEPVAGAMVLARRRLGSSLTK